MKRRAELYLSPPVLYNTEALLRTPGVCYYIPIYQRDLIWGKEDVQRFFEGIVQGIKDLSSPSDVVIAETFMGTIICFDDGPYYASIDPQIASDLPARVYTLIDGQQRISVSLILAIVLHEHLSAKILSLIEIKDADGQGKQLLKLKKEIEDNLFDMLASGACINDRRYYPRIIESQRDRWSTKSEFSKYSSPISALLFNYVEHVNNKSEGKFVLEKSDNTSFNKMRSIYSSMKCYVDSLAKAKNNMDYSFGVLPSIDKLLRKSVYKGLLECSNPIDFKSLKQQIEAVSDTEDDKPEEILEFIVRIVIFASYFLKRIRYIRMVTTSDHLAINIFDSLNTTGVPLTALETLIPMVGKTYMSLNEKFEDSTSWKMLKEIKKHISFFKQEEQAVKTKDLLVSFALSESGEKLSTSLGLQRSYMLEQYERHNKGANPEQNVKEFISNLLHVTRVRMAFAGCKTDFVKCLEEEATASKHIQLAKEASFCLKFLAASNHRITIPIIARFYSEYLRSKRKKVADHQALCRAICASAAFFALWRFPKESTGNIDHHHRAIMGSRLSYARACTFPKVPDSTSLQKEYCRCLQKDLKISESDNELSKDQWRKNSTSRPIYKTQQQVARFILLLSAYSDSRKVATGGGIFDSMLWDHEAHETIEHISPQNPPDNGKKAENDEDSGMQHRIGNLTLLPSKVNSYIGNAVWPQRRLIYAVLSAENEQSFNDEVVKLSLDRKKEKLIRRDWDAINKLYSGAYLPAIKDIAESNEFEFGREQIQKRGEKILNSAWGVLATWLGTE